MSELKITIDQFKNYLGTGLIVYKSKEKGVTWKVGKSILTPEYLCHMLAYPNSNFVLECYRLSDLDKFIPELGFVPLIKMVQECHFGDPNEDWFCGEAIRSRSHRKVYNIGYGDIKWEIELGYPPALRFDYYQKLFQWHFWPFGDEYFEAGLVIDKLKITEK